MGQRKLTDGEITCVMEARVSMRAIAAIARSNPYVERAITELNDIALHGTTDGKPYVEPQPEIGEGYRLATEADSMRRDRRRWCDGFWVGAEVGVTIDKRVYCVPVDRIPTDEDAVGRPVVMVKDDGDDEAWQPGKLIEVDSGSPHQPFYVRTDLYKESFWWDRCRFPYPGELP